MSIEDWNDVSNKEDKDVVTIPLSRNLNPYFEDVLEASQGFIEEILENKNLQDSQVDPITKLSSAKAIQKQINNENSNLRGERLRHSIRHNRKDYQKLHIKEFAKMIIAHALMSDYDESLIYKKAVNDLEREQ